MWNLILFKESFDSVFENLFTKKKAFEFLAGNWFS